jgi:hypothetical protein
MEQNTIPASNTEPWPTIVERYRLHRHDRMDAPFREALQAIEALAEAIAMGQLSPKLFGWTSMFDLCIQQTDAVPYSGPHLKVSAMPSGVVEFRYVDTTIRHRQWHREVEGEAVIERFHAFLEQLCWLA